MDPENTALPTGDTAAAGEQAQDTQAAATTTEQAEQQGQEQQTAEAADKGFEGAESEQGEDKPGKKEKTPEQREIERLRRRVDNLTRRRYELEARAGQEPPPRQQGTEGSDDEPVTLSRAELQKLIAEQAKQAAPVIAEQQAEIERRQGVVAALAKQWGKEEFNAKADDLYAAFGGLMDRSGRPKPATDAIFDADNPKELIEYLTDPENAEEAERISRLTAVRAGREVARIELRLAEAKKQAKPQRSNAARPLEAVKGGGVPNGMPDPSNTKAYVKWANEQERAAR